MNRGLALLLSQILLGTLTIGCGDSGSSPTNPSNPSNPSGDSPILRTDG